jgi:hypothetical protein
VRQGREWRIINNEEIDNIIRKKDIGLCRQEE